MKNLTNDREEFKMIIKDIANHPTVLEMKNFRQHYDTSCYDHCQNVAYYSYLFCDKIVTFVTKYVYYRIKGREKLKIN